MPDLPPMKIIRSKRRTVGLQILPDATLVVKVPFYYPKFSINHILKEKEDWIRTTQQKILLRKQQTPKRQFIAGEKFLYLGVEYSLTIKSVTKSPVEFDNGFILCSFNQKSAHTYLTNWYKKQALKVFTERVAYYAQKKELPYGEVNISSATTQWGSCSPDDNLRFNWLLIMAPLPVLDYVVAHELAHITHKNHSRQFWQEVMRMSPEYRLHRRWLNTHAHLLKV